VTRPSRTRAGASRWVPLAALGLILVVALAVGVSGHSSATSVDDRVHRITSQIRCPVCSGETVADSAAPISQDIRTTVRQQLQAGRSDHDVYAYIVHQYPGTSLTPPASGVGLLVWALPIAVFAAAVAGLGFTFARWRGRPGVAVSDEDRRLVQQARHDADD
jgi:cytochrome c-type biogenesis protein CcmH